MIQKIKKIPGNEETTNISAVDIQNVHVDTPNLEQNIDSPEYSYSLFDGNHAEILPSNQAGLQSNIHLPKEYRQSLHSHSHPVTAGDFSNPIFISGDSVGFVNIWSPVSSSFQ